MSKTRLIDNETVRARAFAFKEWSGRHQNMHFSNTPPLFSSQALPISLPSDNDLTSFRLLVNGKKVPEFKNEKENDQYIKETFYDSAPVKIDEQLILFKRFYNNETLAKMLLLAMPISSKNVEGEFLLSNKTKKTFNLKWNYETLQFEIHLTISNISKIQPESSKIQKFPGEIKLCCVLTENGFKLKSLRATTPIAKMFVLHADHQMEWLKVEKLKSLSDEAIQHYEKVIEQAKQKEKEWLAKLEKRTQEVRDELTFLHEKPTLKARLAAGPLTYVFNAKEADSSPEKTSPLGPTALKWAAPSITPYTDTITIAQNKLRSVVELRATLNSDHALTNLHDFKAKHAEIAKLHFVRQTSGASNQPLSKNAKPTLLMEQSRDSYLSRFFNLIKVALGWKLGITESEHFMQSSALVFNRGVKNNAKPNRGQPSKRLSITSNKKNN